MGEPLPQVPALQPIYAQGQELRRGQMLMIAGIPGSGKSSLAEYLVAHMNVPTLFFSADQDSWTTLTKLAATITGDQTRDVATALASGKGADRYKAALRETKVWCAYDPSPSIEDIGRELDAYVEIHDEWPHVILVDNLTNLQGESDWQSDGWILSELHWIARATKALVIVLVHASESTANATWPAKRKEIINKLSKLPETVFTVANNPADGTFLICLAKSREVQADPAAERPSVLGVDLGRMQFYQQPISQHRWGGYTNDYEEDDD